MTTTAKANRPIFIPNYKEVGVIEENIEFTWHKGMSAEVRKRSMKSLHEKIKEKKGDKKILEASSKSENDLGIKLSAFYLKNGEYIPVENLFQSSKKFESGGPYRDLLSVSPKDAKRDKRLKESGDLVSFEFNGESFPLEPKSLFYDWLYMKTLFRGDNDELVEKFIKSKFEIFTDIEFNPKKSFNCQARTLALAISLNYHNEIDNFINDPEYFIEIHKNIYGNKNSFEQQKLL